MDPTYPLFSVFSFVACLLVLIPLPWHAQAWNVGTCAYIFWASVACLFEFINSLVWRNTTTNYAPVWCDISSKVILGAGIGIPAASLCISRRLYTISAIKSTAVTLHDKRRAIIIDSCIAFGLPILVMALHYVVQGHRFDILEDIGCYSDIYYTLVAYPLIFMWPTILGGVSFVFSALTLHAFYMRRLEFTQFLSTHSSISMSRYIRLMVLATSEMLCMVPISIYSVYIANVGIPLQPWVSWAYVHYNFSYVGQVPAVEWMSNPDYRIAVQLTRWLYPAAALWFFILFGFATEARKNYCAAFLRVAKFFGYKPACKTPGRVPQWKSNFKKISVGSLPVYAPPRFKNAKSNVPSVAKPFDIDIEKAAGCSTPSVSNYSPRDQQSSPTSRGDTEESGDTTPIFTPFSVRSTFPESESFDNVHITVQTRYSTAA